MFTKILFLASMFLFLGNASDNIGMYHKEYYETGTKKAEGWLNKGNKTGYWKFYHPNGKVAQEGRYKNGKKSKYWMFLDHHGKRSKEGHYKNGVKSGWWVFYEKNGKIDYKCQFSGGVKNGYFLQYNFGKLTSASKYRDGKKLKEWYSYRSFKRENNLSDLR